MALTGNFDVYYLLVELIFGNIIAAYFGVVLLIFVIGVMTKMNMLTLLGILVLFSASYLTLWYGGIAITVIFLLTFAYFMYALYRYFKEASG